MVYSTDQRAENTGPMFFVFSFLVANKGYLYYCIEYNPI